MGGIADEHVEWAIVNRLKAMLDEPPPTPFHVTQTFALFSSVLLWTKNRAWVAGNLGMRGNWEDNADHRAHDAREGQSPRHGARAQPHDNAKWTVATYLPYLWRPETHMFLKPEATKDFAIRVGHRFASDYEAQLNLPVYESLLDLVNKTAGELADLRPRDRIDIQSLIWVVRDYQEGREGTYA